MRTARLLAVSCRARRGLPPPPPHPPDADPLPPGYRPHPEADTPWRQTHPPWTEGMRHACENITLPQTSFAGGKYTFVVYTCFFSDEIIVRVIGEDE